GAGTKPEGWILVWKLGGRQRTAKVGTYEGVGLHVQYSPDGKTLFSCSDRDGAVVWRAGDPLVARFERLSQYPARRPAWYFSTAMALSADGKTLAVANIDNLIQVWDVSATLARAPRERGN